MKKYHYLYLVHDGAVIKEGDFKKLGITNDLNRRLSEYNTNCIRPINYLENYQCESKLFATSVESELKDSLKDYLIDNTQGFQETHKTEVFLYNNDSKKIFDQIIKKAIDEEKIVKMTVYNNPYVGNKINKKFNAKEYKLKITKISEKYLSKGITEKEILDIITKNESFLTGKYEKHPTRPKELIKLGSVQLWYTTQGSYLTYYHKYCDIENDLGHLLRIKSNELNFTHEVSLIIDQLLKKGMKKNEIVGLLKKCRVAYELSDDISDWKKPKIEGGRGLELPLPASFNNIDLYWENKSGPESRWRKYFNFKKELANIE